MCQASYLQLSTIFAKIILKATVFIIKVEANQKAGLWIPMDPIGKILRKKQKNARKLVVIVNLWKKLSKLGLAPWYIT